MFFRLARFEILYFLRQPSFLVTSLVFLLLPFFAMISTNVQIGGSSNVNFNAPHAISQSMLIMSVVGMFLVANFVGGTAVRDIAHKMDGIMLSTPISKRDYLWGRWFGSLLVCLLVFLAVPIGILLGSVWPTVDPERLGDTMLAPYFWVYLIFVIPNFIFCSALFYVMALKARSMMGMYLGVVAFFILYELTSDLSNTQEYLTVAALADPFGFGAFLEATRYWTPFERNSQLVPFDKLVLWNRVIWLTVSIAFIGVAHAFIDMRKLKNIRASKNKDDTEPKPTSKLTLSKGVISSSAEWLRFRTRTLFEVAQIIKSAPFIILCLISLFTLGFIFFDASGIFGTANWPVTRNMTDYVQGSFGLMMLIIITFYSGEIVWRERSIGMGDIIESTPTQNWSLYFPKIFALTAVVVCLTLVGIVFSVLYQVFKSYYAIEWHVYFGLLSLEFVIPMVLTAVLAVFIQILSPNKYVGMLAFVVFFVGNIVLSQLGLEHRMWRFASSPIMIYSDLNTYGHFLLPAFWYNLYWLGLTIVLAVLGFSLWPRGTEFALRHRLGNFGQHLSGASRVSLVFGLLLFAGAAANITYNTRVVNTFLTSDEQLDRQAEYEKKYVQFKDLPLPTITDVTVAVDFYPNERRVVTKGTYLFLNKHATSLEKVLVSWDGGDHREVSFKIAGATETSRDDRFASAWMHFSPPLQPGEQSRMDFEFVRANKGFVDRDPDNRVVKNGSFINNGENMPHFGYNKEFEIADRHERRKRDLSPPERLPLLEDASHYGTNFISAEADFINFEATLSTSDDQFAIAPGYLLREWKENGRRYFHYKMDAPIFNFVAFLSGKWHIEKDEHNGVSIEVFHQPQHNMNVARMIEATKDSLDYFGEQFSPYQHRQVRILEFPRYDRFAQSFSNTIPYSEDIGFLADLRDVDSIDYVYFVTAHEMAHQWWGHQIVPANVQGSAVLSETLSEYSAYMLMENTLGKDHLRKFLKYEMDRYLGSRSSETVEEMPLYRAENQAYIHYQKGGVVMYSLRDRFGEETINRALRLFLNKYQYQSDPYPTTRDLLAYLKAEIPPEGHDMVDDLFTRITLFDLKVTEATAKELADGKYQVDMNISAEKFYADGQGEETVVDFEDVFDIGVFSMDPDSGKAKDHVLHFAKHPIKTGENKISVIVDALPKYAGVDPYIKMIDRNSDDNLKQVSVE